jgi:uncharacterized protein (TIGR03067 family)
MEAPPTMKVRNLLALGLVLLMTGCLYRSKSSGKAPVPFDVDVIRRQELLNLQGDWVVVAVTDDGKAWGPDDVRDMNFTFSADSQLWQTYDRQVVAGSRLALRPEGQLKEIDMPDLRPPRKPRTGRDLHMIRGIYTLETDRFRLCYNLDDVRPTALEAGKGTGNILVEMERRKAPPVELPEAVRAELKLLQGNWYVVAGKENGKDWSPQQRAATTFTFKDDILTMTENQQRLYYNFVTLRPEATPKEIDLPAMTAKAISRTVTRPRALPGIDRMEVPVLPGIYKLEGGRLTICYNAGEKPIRPIQYASSERSGNTLIVLERNKP